MEKVAITIYSKGGTIHEQCDSIEDAQQFLEAVKEVIRRKKVEEK